MKKSNLKKKLVLAMSVVMIFGCVNVPSYAITNGWMNATELTSGTTVTTDAITSATAEKWYKFTATEANSRCVIMLDDIPTSRAYNCELRYQETEGARPVIVENTMSESRTGKFYIKEVLENTGTYYIRVYSLTGESDSSPYTLKLTCTTASITYGIAEYTGHSKLDWAVCAEMIGKSLYKQTFDYNTTNRTHQNAARFIQSSGSDDTAEAATNTRKNIQDVATAANYVFSGDYMATPAFVVTEEFMTVPDFLRTLAVTNKKVLQKPVVVQEKMCEGLEHVSYYQYKVVVGADVANDMVCLYEPETGDENWIDYTDWVSPEYDVDTVEEFPYAYNGKNVVYAG